MLDLLEAARHILIDRLVPLIKGCETVNCKILGDNKYRTSDCLLLSHPNNAYRAP